MFTIKGNGFIQQAGNLYLMRPDFFHPAEAPQLTEDKRIHPIWFGPPKEIESYICWHLPDGLIA